MSDTMAWYGIVQMKEAKWLDNEGTTVTFYLPMDGQEDKRNPFEKFTKRRKGKAGTRFMLACQRMLTKAKAEPIEGGVRFSDHQEVRESIYEDEAMLAGWNDAQTTGHTVKFWLCNDAMGHPFEGCTRKLDQFAISLVELDDDQEPVDQKMRDRVEQGSKRPSERLSYVAAMICKEPAFWAYCNSVIEEEDWVSAKVDSEEDARRYICNECGILSRAELDKEGQHVQIFHDKIRKPYLGSIGEDR
jgi:hypothetical protein